MNVIITAGGTRERIDAVRTIANHATGRLGSLIADEFSRKLSSQNHTIYYLCGMDSELPAEQDSSVQIIRTEGTGQLQSEIKRLLLSARIDAVVHSMAVSDYRVRTVATAESVAKSMAELLAGTQPLPRGEEWNRLVLQALAAAPVVTDGKISSTLEHPVLLLEKTPKIIEMIQKISPGTVLVGFKLLSGANEETLLQTAYRLLKKNRCNFVLANDTDSITPLKHKGYLIDKDANYTKYTGKNQIAAGIVENVLKELQRVAE